MTGYRWKKALTSIELWTLKKTETVAGAIFGSHACMSRRRLSNKFLKRRNLHVKNCMQPKMRKL